MFAPSPARPFIHRAGLVILLLLLFGCGPNETPTPNILVIVVDTLRYDHLSFYGYDRPTSPKMEESLASRGAVFEDAYSQAPWTLPSIASLFSGYPPEDLLDPEGNPSGLPDGVESLAESLSGLGYRTAAFIANPTVHQGNGFAQGFETFYTAPYELESMHRHAEEVNQRAIPWLQAQGDEPYFLYLHYLDPHDPYENPDMPDGVSPFDSGYQGHVQGTDVHGLYLGALSLPDPVADLAHLKALYDGEILYVDRHIGELLQTIPPATLKNTIVILTSDHGEEFLDHGGWKHGETLYEELIHVPLIIRWDGKIKAGLRIEGTVSLLDLKPTLMAAAGAGTVESKHGTNLLPTLLGEAPLPDRPSFAGHFSGGPLRASVTQGGRKAILFDRNADWEPVDERQEILWTRDFERMQRLEIYDLDADPGETVNRLEDEDSWAELAQHLVIAEQDRFWQGLRLLASGLPDESVVQGELRLPGATSIKTFFLGPEDRYQLTDGVLSFSLSGGGAHKGLLIDGPIEAMDGLDLSFEGLEELRLRVGNGEIRSIGRNSAPNGLEAGALRNLLVKDYPGVKAGPSLQLWLRRPDERPSASPRDAETIRRMQALGYLD